MRIGHFLPHFPTDGAIGGTGLAVVGLSRAFAAIGHRVFIYGYGRGQADIGSNVVVRGFRSPPGPRGMLALFGVKGDLFSHVAANNDQLDVMLIHGAFGSSTGMLERACRAQGIPTIAYPHIPYAPALFADRRLLKWSFFALFERPYLSRVNAIHVHAPSHAAYVAGLKVLTPCIVIPCGVRPELLDDQQGPDEDWVDEQSARTDRFRILYFGRLDIWMKGLDLLIEAIALEPSFRDIVEVSFVGDGEPGARDQLARLAERHGIADIVSFRGHTDRPWHIVREADLVVLPSRFDGFAQTVCEALSLGTPVLVSTRAAPAEHLNRTHGVLLTEPDPEAIRRALGEAVRCHRELRDAARAVKPYLRASFGWEPIAAQWIEQFRRMGMSRDGKEGSTH